MSTPPLFAEKIHDWPSWGRVYQSVSAFTPLAREIYRREGLLFEGLSGCTPGTNTVFRVGETVLKIFAPEASGQSLLDYRVERLGLERANRLGVSAPRLLAAGVIEDRYRFPYLIMERLSGVSLGALLESDCLSPQEQRRIGRQLREITDRMNTPCPGFSSPDVLARALDNPRWEGFLPAFNSRRREYLLRRRWGERVYVHGDLNPDNLIVGPEGRICLLDFADSCLAPVEYEQALVAVELFQFRPALLEGYFGRRSPWELAQLCLAGLLLHDFGPSVIRERLDGSEAFPTLESLGNRLEQRLAESLCL